MTNEEKDLLIAYRVDAGDIDPECDVEAQFLEWYQVREQVVSGEVHYKALLQATRMRARSFEEGRRAGPWPRAQPSGAGTSWRPAQASTASWTMLAGWRPDPR